MRILREEKKLCKFECDGHHIPYSFQGIWQLQILQLPQCHCTKLLKELNVIFPSQILKSVSLTDSQETEKKKKGPVVSQDSKLTSTTSHLYIPVTIHRSFKK